MMNIEDIRQALVNRRIALKITRTQVSKSSGVSEVNIWKFESGLSSAVRFDTIHRLCVALDMSIDVKPLKVEASK